MEGIDHFNSDDDFVYLADSNPPFRKLLKIKERVIIKII